MFSWCVWLVTPSHQRPFSFLLFQLAFERHYIADPNHCTDTFKVVSKVLDSRKVWYDKLEAKLDAMALSQKTSNYVMNHELFHHPFLTRFSNLDFDLPEETIIETFATE